MHELSLALSILDVAEEEAERRRIASVAAIHVQVGAISGVVNKTLRSAFEIARADSYFPNVELVIHEVPCEVFCHHCAVGMILEPPWKLECPRCYGSTPHMIRGRELEIIALEIDS